MPAYRHKRIDWNKYDLTEEVGNYNNKNKKMKFHSARTIAGLAIIFIIGGIQAMHGQSNMSSTLEMAIPFLLMLEHAFLGNIK